jgi:flagellar biosynthetic protein FlhB
MADKQQKTEQPTQRRLKKAREDGNFPTARVCVSAAQFLACVAIIHARGPLWVISIRTAMAEVLGHALDPRLGPAELTALGIGLARRILTPFATLGAILVGVTLAIQLGITRFGVSLKKLTPDPKRLSPLSRLRQALKQNGPAFVQASVMIPVFGLTVYVLVRDNLDAYLALPLQTVSAGAARIGNSIDALLWKAAMVFVVFGAADLFRQQRQYTAELKMSKQDIRDELKEMEGSPLIKQRIRRLRRDMARRRMMHEIPTATAVIVNPTHYAVALKYDMGSPGAPKVVAKGKNYLALRIRQRAVENQVPLIENPPLAQGLYKSVEIGQEIPAQFYRAVAEVLAYIYKLMQSRIAA